MIEQKNTTKNLKFYSQKSIGLATFIGSPLAAGYLISENFKTLNKHKEGKKSLIIGIVSTILLFASMFMIPESIIDKIPNQIIPFIYMGIIYLIVEKIHGKILNKHKEFENEFFSGWKAAGIGLISLLIVGIGIFGFIYLSENDSIEYEMYNTELNKFSKTETETLVFYDHLNTETSQSLLQELDEIIPKWKNNIEIIKKSNEIENLPSELLKQNKILLKYSELRLKAFELFKKEIGANNDEFSKEIDQIHIDIDEQLDKLN